MECGDGFLTCCLVVCGFLTHHQQQHFPIVVVVLVCLSRTVHLVGTRFNICRWLAASTYCTICHGAVRLRGNNTPATDSGPRSLVVICFGGLYLQSQSQSQFKTECIPLVFFGTISLPYLCVTRCVGRVQVRSVGRSVAGERNAKSSSSVLYLLA